MLVRKLELRFCMARTANALAIFHDGHHRDPGALARWTSVMPRPVSSRKATGSSSRDFTISAPKVSCVRLRISSRLEK